MRYRSAERLRSLSRQIATAQVNGREGNHDGDASANLLKGFLYGIQRGLGVQRVKYGLNHQDVNAAIEQTLDRLGISFNHCIEANIPKSWIIYVGRERKCLVCRTYAPRDKSGMLWISQGELICYVSRVTGSLPIYFVGEVFQSEFCQTESR